MYICNCSYTSKLKAVFFFGLILSLCCACSRAGARRVSSYDHYWVKAADERVEADRNGRIICSIISIAVRGAVVWLCDKNLHKVRSCKS